MSDSIVRNRTSYGKVFREVLMMLHGFGIDPKRVEIERVQEQSGPRVRWDLIVDDQVFFEEMAIEEIKFALVGMEMSKILVKDAVKAGNLDVNTLTNVPSEKDIAASIAHSFDKEYADLIVPSAANHNNSNVQRVAASQTAPAREKNPARVEAGRRAAAKRWGAEVPANA